MGKKRKKQAEPVTNIAGRPHGHTYVMWAVGLLMAVLLAVTGWLLTQRAVVSMRITRLQIVAPELRDGLPRSGFLHYVIEINNSGATRPELVELTVALSLPDGWEIAVPWMSPDIRAIKGRNAIRIINVEMPAKDKTTIKDVRIGLSLSEEAASRYAAALLTTIMDGRGVGELRGPIEVTTDLTIRNGFMNSFHTQIRGTCSSTQLHSANPMGCGSGVRPRF